MTDFFQGIAPIRYEGPDTANEFAFRHYNPDEVVLGKRMEDHMRFSVAYWHSFAWPGGDPFGGQTFDRPWFVAAPDIQRLWLNMLAVPHSRRALWVACFSSK